MKRPVVSIAHKYNEGLVEEIDRSNFFHLGKKENDMTRADLFNFALALGYKAGYSHEISKKTSFYRTESTSQNNKYLYSSILFKESISNDIDKIDDIVNDDMIYDMAEEYADTGFSVLKDYKDQENGEEILMLTLISEMDEVYKQFKEDFKF